jgi:hypothetical protein
MNTTLTETLIPESKNEKEINYDDIPECVYEDVKFSGNNEIIINGKDKIDWEPFVCKTLLKKKSRITIKDVNSNFLNAFSSIFNTISKLDIYTQSANRIYEGNPILKELILKNCSDDGEKIPITTFILPKLTKFVANNSLDVDSPDFIKFFPTFIDISPELEYLDLGDNNISENAAQCVLENIQKLNNIKFVNILNKKAFFGFGKNSNSEAIMGIQRQIDSIIAEKNGTIRNPLLPNGGKKRKTIRRRQKKTKRRRQKKTNRRK